MVGIDSHDVVVPGDRPVRAEHAVLAVMDRVFPAQTIEIGPVCIGAEQLGIAGIELVQRKRISALARSLDPGILADIDGPVQVCINYIPWPRRAQGRLCRIGPPAQPSAFPIGALSAVTSLISGAKAEDDQRRKMARRSRP